mmetsp:Transcript_23823/g.41989  ORF Transcript_23823/g.41989 Transcript_23823/m.41989 type:complete len:407 (+) Transcript_23823:223-1443(+)
MATGQQQLEQDRGASSSLFALLNAMSNGTQQQQQQPQQGNMTSSLKRVLDEANEENREYKRSCSHASMASTVTAASTASEDLCCSTPHSEGDFDDKQKEEKEEFQSSVPDVGIKASFHNRSAWKSRFVRTRHKNLRCFPACSAQHVESGFCGDSVFIWVSMENPDSVKDLNLTAHGCLRKTTETRLHEVGKRASSIRDPEFHEPNEVFVGEWKQYDAAEKRWLVEFSPPRRWRYHTKLAKHTMKQAHVFSAYILGNVKDENEQTCVATADSPEFRLQSAWKQTASTPSLPLLAPTFTEPKIAPAVDLSQYLLQAQLSMLLGKSLSRSTLSTTTMLQQAQMDLLKQEQNQFQRQASQQQQYMARNQDALLQNNSIMQPSSLLNAALLSGLVNNQTGTLQSPGLQSTF